MSELSIKLQHTLELRDEQKQLIYYVDKWYDNHELQDAVHRLHSILRQIGVRAGQRVIIAEPNSIEFAAAYVGLILYGALIVPVNPDMARAEFEQALVRSNAVCAIIGTNLREMLMNCESKVRFLIEYLEPHSAILQCDVLCKHELGWTSMPLTSSQPARCTFPELPENTPAILIFTSGTTGNPKGVVLTHGHIMATASQVISSHRLTENDVSYCFLPLFHINAEVIVLLSTLLTSGRVVIEKKFSASKFWKTIVEHNITWISAVPAVIAILLRTSRPLADVPPSLRFVRSASAPLPAQNAREFEQKFGVPVIESYGMTEAASQICVNPLPPGIRKIGSVGLPRGIDLQIIDDAGNRVSPFGPGEIVIRGASVISAYDGPGTGAESFRDGWFHTGDIGFMDSDGYVYITGRRKEMINRSGQKISPREVEEVIAQHRLVRIAAVIGLPDDIYGERVAAYVIPECAQLDEGQRLFDELDTMCHKELSRYKCPAEFHLIDTVPVGPTGKIQHNRLKQQVMEDERVPS